MDQDLSRTWTAIRTRNCRHFRSECSNTYFEGVSPPKEALASAMAKGDSLDNVERLSDLCCKRRGLHCVVWLLPADRKLGDRGQSIETCCSG